ncbi:5-dehydro-4-deoxy-D-glucuronate isomerase [Entomospira entomophila]|uniref:4-deoxy-L-threo-5-hexosulose-uronate ketol-isomerase n=1 Tax=Entomospira entomophila TaxID=2719988 RepID=A0A968GDI2_9SPIO|nr:5-dehydro-4-deoxy-D-glucuronate isomerase [Entomospira entomophilus]NIZ41019.1 5-dehydro-4-deoxy-D-glucuronate isomerase [Entomospira entomophilus]WDI35231.1 5-dehydro-4-deoxy-D-glucuronate isomerase [Entomospira entomophilus]
MKQYYQISPKEFSRMNTQELRDNFLIETIFLENQATIAYTHYDRMIVGGVMPLDKEVSLPNGSLISAEYFLERREIGIINIGGEGSISIDGRTYPMVNKDGIYIGRGIKDVRFSSNDVNNPAKFYYNSAPAHIDYPTVKITFADAVPNPMGDPLLSNKRTIYQYVHPKVCQSAQLLMGLTMLEPGNMWNTMPAHTHDRRMESYFYFDLKEGSKVFHLMGEPTETRHIVVAETQAVVSPSWSLHSGVGTGAYTFIWAMAGENQDFTDMDHIAMDDLR